MGNDLEKGAISAFRTWKEGRMAEIKRREQELAALLKAAVPQSFSVWLAEAGETVIENLLEYGLSSRKYRREYDGVIYGYTDLNEFEQRFEELKVAWHGVVGIDIIWDGDYRFEVTFTVF
ncbi:MAG: hypothetical protein WC310_01020 [Patescibacteria group bacterium]|jgi:hypothetical protein